MRSAGASRRACWMMARMRLASSPTLVGRTSCGSLRVLPVSLVPLPGGRDTADNIAGARLLTIAGMGHDLPLALVDTLADAIAEHANAVAVTA